MENYNFEQNDYVSYDDFKYVLKQMAPEPIATYLYPKLEKYLVINNGRLYELQRNMIYFSDNDDELLEMKISSLLSVSYEALESDKKDMLQELYKSQLKSLFQINTIKKYSGFIHNKLCKRRIILDNYLNQLHFINGYINLETGEFKQRVIGQHYVSQCIQFNYEPSKKKTREQLLSNTINKILPIDEDKHCMGVILGSAITGISTNEQKSLFIYGNGSAGKSTILLMCQYALECYVKKIKSDVFSQNSKDATKVLNSFLNSPQYRITIINEMKDDRMNSSMFKEFCEGSINTTLLYKDNDIEINHKSLLITTMNTLPNFVVDSGMTRRIIANEHKSKFTEDENEVDESKHIYLKDKSLLENFKNDDKLKCAWIDILVSYARQYLETRTIKLTKNFEITKDLIVASNDRIQDFIDSKLVHTKDSNDRIGKEQMYKLFCEACPDKHLNDKQLLSALKGKGIDYQCDWRVNNVKGCYAGVKLRNQLTDDTEEDPFEYGIPKDDKQKIIDDQAKLIKQLQEQIKQLQQQLNTQPIKPTVQEQLKVFVEEIDDDEEDDEQDEDESEEEQIKEIKQEIKRLQQLVSNKEYTIDDITEDLDYLNEMLNQFENVDDMNDDDIDDFILNIN
jgi:energy-coupling factor transporter ATP-binding protein EcfA2